MTERYSPSEEQLFRKLKQDLHDVVRNETLLKKSVNNFYNNLIDELTLGIIFDLHRQFKTESYSDSYDWSVEMQERSMKEWGNERIRICSGTSLAPLDCPICEKKNGSEKFSEHLANCMGIPKKKRETRNSNRQQGSQYYLHSDDETTEDGKTANQDLDWDKDKKRGKKTKKNTSKGSKKFSPKKQPARKIDDDDSLSHLNVLQLEDSNSNSTSPTLSTGSTSYLESSKKKIKSKSQKKNS